MLRLAIDAITGFSFFPLQVAIYFSLVLGVMAVLALPLVVFLRLAAGEAFLEGQATTLSVVLVLSAFQFFFFFVMGQYIARIYDEVRGRPLYVVADTYGIALEEREIPARVFAEKSTNRPEPEEASRAAAQT
jgi:polyisoprenyl-phosphate glycosyltransferase